MSAACDNPLTNVVPVDDVHSLPGSGNPAGLLPPREWFRLLDTNGPFEVVTRDQHQQNGKLQPLPWDTLPPGLYGPPTYTA